MSDDPEPNRKEDPEAWQAWFNRQVASHDDQAKGTSDGQDFEISPGD